MSKKYESRSECLTIFLDSFILFIVILTLCSILFCEFSQKKYTFMRSIYTSEKSQIAKFLYIYALSCKCLAYLKKHLQYYRKYTKNREKGNNFNLKKSGFRSDGPKIPLSAKNIFRQLQIHVLNSSIYMFEQFVVFI